MRNALRPLGVVLALTLATAACGDPGFNFSVRNDSPSEYLLRLVVRIKEVDIQNPGVIVFEVPPATAGWAYGVSGTWGGEVGILSPACAALANF